MTTRRLYNIGISSRSQTRAEERSRQQLAQQGVLGSDTGSVTSIASDPDEETLVAEFAGKYAEQMIAELSELASAGGIDAVPYFGTTQDTPVDGYYSVSTANTGRVDPRFVEVESFDGTLAKEGTIASHRRAVATDISEADHPFGNDQTALVGVPAAASKLQWYDAETGDREEPTIVDTRTGEHGDVDVVSATASSFYDGSNEQYPELVFRLPYADEGRVDPRVWDSYGYATKTDAEDVVRWQTVFSSSHEFQGNAILSNGLIRLVIDESAPSLTVEEWDDANTQWSSVALGTSGWELFDLDIREIGLASVHAVVEFHDPTQDPTEYYRLNCRLKRGWEYPLWSEIDGEGGTPTDLVDLLDPIASESNYDPGESQGLRKRSEL